MNKKKIFLIWFPLMVIGNILVDMIFDYKDVINLFYSHLIHAIILNALGITVYFLIIFLTKVNLNTKKDKKNFS